MSQYLPYGSFKWLSNEELNKIDLGKYKEDSGEGLVLEVHLEYPNDLHELHNDYPLAPEKVLKTCYLNTVIRYRKSIKSLLVW